MPKKRRTEAEWFALVASYNPAVASKKQFFCQKHAISPNSLNAYLARYNVPVVTAPMPAPLIHKSAASPSLVSYIISEKFVKAMPLYRQEQEFARQGLTISRQNMSSWIIRTTTDYLNLVYETLKASLSQESVLHADETVLQVLNEPGKKASTNSYMWVYTTGATSQRPVALYEYQPTRSSSSPKAFLADFSGYLHTDGYAGYDALVKAKPDITLVRCWAHARRKFDEACRAIKDEAGRKTSQAAVGLVFCNQLFALERDYQEQKLTPYRTNPQRFRTFSDCGLSGSVSAIRCAMPPCVFAQSESALTLSLM